MVCEHLVDLEQELLNSEIKETFRGKAWSRNCREWVYFDCYLDLKSIKERSDFSDCVVEHDYCGTHDGQESGFKCTICLDGIMGHHRHYADGKKIIK